MKRWIAAGLAALALTPALALAEITVHGQTQSDGVNQVTRFFAEPVGWADVEGERVLTTEAAPELSEEEQLAQETLLLQLNGQIDMVFSQARAQQLYENAQSGGRSVIHQTSFSYADDKLASLALLWDGMQPDGTQGVKPYTLSLDLTTGMPIAFDALFDDPDAAAAAMEAIIERDYLEEMNVYVEEADLLPLPRESFSFDETGLTVYYGDDRYRTYDGNGGYVTFYWYEIAAYIGEESPVYALSRPQEADAQAIRYADGYFGGYRLLGLYEPLGKAMLAYNLTDEPDYTADSILYPLSAPQLRGMSVEIPKYAETEEEETPISAVRHSRISWHGLTTGETLREQIVELLGEPEATILYDEDDASDMMLEPGESLLYSCESSCGSMVLEAHLDGDGVLSCIILRDAMPERLY